MAGLKLFAKAALLVGLIVASSLLVYIYYGELTSFFLEASPAYRGLAIFSLGFLGATSIIVPIPYTAVILCLFARIPDLNLLEVALWGGLGSGLGEVLGWILGRSFRWWIHDSRYGVRLKAFSRLASSDKARWLIPLVVFLFAYSPLPDDALFIILGAINYSLAKALVLGVLGKASMLYTIGFFGKLIGEATSALPDWASVAIALAMILAFLALVELVDWEALLERLHEGKPGLQASRP